MKVQILHYDRSTGAWSSSGAFRGHPNGTPRYQPSSSRYTILSQKEKNQVYYDMPLYSVRNFTMLQLGGRRFFI